MFDELICSNTMKFEEFRENHNSEFYIPLFHKNLSAGSLKLLCFITMNNQENEKLVAADKNSRGP